MRAVQRQLWVLVLCGCAGDGREQVAHDTTSTATTTTSAAATSTGEGTIDPTTGSGASSSESSSTATTAAVTTDAGDTTGGASFDCAAALLCDDFEGVGAGAPPDPSRWTITSPDCSGVGSLAVSDAAAHSGMHS